MKTLLNKQVYTPHGKAKVVFEFSDGTVAVCFEETGSGMVLHKDSIFVRPDPSPSSAYAHLPYKSLFAKSESPSAGKRRMVA